MKYSISALRASVLSLALCSCANTVLTRTGFLEDRASLRPAPQHEVAWIPDAVEWYLADDVDLSGIEQLVLAPIQFDFSEAGANKLPASSDREFLIAEFEDAMRYELGKEFSLTHEEGGDTLLLRVALTDVDEEWVWLNILGFILVVPPDMGGVSCELEVVKSSTGERVLAMAASREGTIFLLLEAFHEWGHAKHGMKKWAKLLRKELSRLRAQGSVVP